MTGTLQRRRARLLYATITVVLAAGVGIGLADIGQLRTQSGAAIQSIGVVPSGTPGLLDRGSTRNTDAGQLHRPFDHDGVADTVNVNRTLPWIQAQAGVLERADHPERRGRILLRGPPGPSG